MDRRKLIRHSLALGSLAALGACTTNARPRPMGTSSSTRKPELPLYRLSPDRITDIRCCLRPFRPMGPRLDTETIGDKLVIHNYGHGGSGWSLSWGSADIAVEKARSVLPDAVAVIGCGIIGLTSAIAAQRAGMDVTIYTRDLLPRTRSVRANGRWTPDSRIALTAPAGPGFGQTWERMARFSWKTFLTYVGLPGHPIEFSDYYNLSDGGPAARHADGKGDYASTGMPQSSSEFASYGSRIADINGAPQQLSDADNPFPVRSAKLSSTMIFNFAPYGDLLMSQFRQAGGKIVIREFHAPSELGGLKEKVIINCPGYAARDLWKDKTLIPVRGQTGWLVPQTEVTYGLNYRNVALLSKRDGVMIQNIDPQGLGEMYGVGDGMELADRTDTEDAVRIMAELFSRMPAQE